MTDLDPQARSLLEAMKASGLPPVFTMPVAAAGEPAAPARGGPGAGSGRGSRSARAGHSHLPGSGAGLFVNFYLVEGQ